MDPAKPKSGPSNEQLVKQYQQTGDNKYLEQIIENNQNFVYKMVKNKINSNNYQLFGDAIQEANIGIILAVRKFDTNRKVKFTTFAYYYVLKAIDIFFGAKDDNHFKLEYQDTIQKIDNIELLDTTILRLDMENLISTTLTPIEQECIRMHYGFYNKIYTTKEISNRLGVNAKHLIQSALIKLRNTSYIRDFYKYQ